MSDHDDSPQAPPVPVAEAPPAGPVERMARIFRFGDYPDKGLSCSREQFVAANGESGVVPIGIDPVRRDHYYKIRDSAFDGLTGEAAFSVGEDDVTATLRMPEMVATAVARAGLKLSAFFPSRLSWRLGKVDFVEFPAIPDAVLFSADEAGDGPVAFTEDDEPVAFCGAGEEAWQSMHDLSGHARPHLCSGSKSFSKSARETGDDSAFRQMHHHAVHHGAYCPAMPGGIHEEVGMSDERDERDGADDAPEAAEEPVTFSADEFRALQAKLRRLEEKSVNDEAVAFADELTRGDRPVAHHAERAGIIEGYARAAAVDAALPTPVAFSRGKETLQGTHVDAFKALYAARPRLEARDPKAAGAHLKPVAFSALDMEPSDADADEQADRERRRELNRRALGKTAAAD